MAGDGLGRAQEHRASRGAASAGPASSALAEALWKRVRAGGMARKVGATVELVSPGRPPKGAGSGPSVVVAGDPGELTLFGSGRQPAARVEISGDADSAERLRTARLGV